MTTTIAETTPRQAARLAGIGYLILFVLAVFANFFVLTGLVEPGDASATASNILESEALFRSGMVAFGIVFVVDVVVAWALYVLFKPVSTGLSLLTAWFRLVYTVFLGVALIFFFLTARLLSGAEFLAVFATDQRDAFVMLMLDAFNYGWLIGLAAFGIHLTLLGYIVLKSGAAPRALGVALAIAGAAYVVDTLAHAVLGNYNDYASIFLVIVAVPAVIAELGFTVWLLARGGRDLAVSA
ncbi:MAG: DUF4386 domain-containing protein [Actinomycetota bacterium]